MLDEYSVGDADDVGRDPVARREPVARESTGDAFRLSFFGIKRSRQARFIVVSVAVATAVSLSVVILPADLRAFS
jgi:hypothetical protein